MRPTHLILASIFAASTIGFTALAQPAAPKEGEKPKAPEGRPTRPAAAQGRNALSPEKTKAAWDAQATGVAKRNSLTEAQTKTLVKAYAEARESHNTASQKLRDDMAAKGGGGGGPDAMAELMTAMEDLNKAEKAKFEKALTGFKAEEVTKVSSSLGSFNRQWDGITNLLNDMKLDSANQQTASDAVEDFIVASNKLRARAGADVDREAMRTATTENRKKLTDALGKVLSAEQLKTIDESLNRGRGGMGGGGGGGGGAPRPAGDKKPDGGGK